jgi:hypothetical protein
LNRTWLSLLRKYHLHDPLNTINVCSRLATNKAKRETFERLAAVHDKAADDLEQLIASGDLPSDLVI